MKIKTSEARILVFLNQVNTDLKFARRMSSKLDMDYVYILRILKDMVEKQWLDDKRRNNKIFYHLTEDAPLKEASSLLSQQEDTK